MLSVDRNLVSPYDITMAFDKIDLSQDTSTVPLRASRISRSPMRMNIKISKKTAGIIAGVVIVLGLFIVLGIVLPAVRLYAQVRILKAQGSALVADMKAEDLVKVSNDLTQTTTEFKKTQDMINGLGYLAFVPVANMYYSDAVHGMKAGDYGLQAARIMVDSLTPYADVLGLKGQGTYNGAAGSRLQTLVLALDKVTPRIDDIAALMQQAKSEVDAIDPNHYPSFIAGGKVRSGVENAKTYAEDAISFVTEAKPLVKQLPTLLGADHDARYLVLFQNDKELRPTGGFITEYAVMRVEKGKPVKEASDDIYSLDATIPNKQSAPRLLATYLPAVPQFNLRDSNLSPDFVTSMKLFYSMYQTSPKKVAVQGIIAMDTQPLITAINALGGSLTVNGNTYTTQIDKRCDCENVIYQLELYADQPVGYIKDNRKGVLSDMLSTILQRVFDAPSRQVLGPLVQGFIQDAQQKHIQFYLFDQGAQQGVEALNVAGQIKPFDGDYLAINEANFGGAKSNMYVTEAVTQDYQVANDGTITKTVTINYKNPNPPSDCNLEHGQLCLNAPLRNVVRMYVPQGSQAGKVTGSEVKTQTYDELGKTVIENFLVIRPLGTAKLSVSYTLPFKLKPGSPLPVMYQKQAGTYTTPYTINVNGNKVQSFDFIQDYTTTLNP